jgi:hypothetical protein
MIAARGTGEDKGTGVIGRIAQYVAKRVEGSVVKPLDYPATWQDPDYEESEAAGVKALTAAVNDYHNSCPDGKIAVFGYSQVCFPLSHFSRRTANNQTGWPGSI